MRITRLKVSTLGLGIVFLLAIIQNLSANSSYRYHFSDNPIQVDSIIQTEETCNLSNGTLTIYATNPTSAYLYSIDDGATFQASNFFDNLPDRDYLVRVFDGVSCTQAFTAQVSDGPKPLPQVTGGCIDGLNRVNIIADILEGLPPFTIDWRDENGTTYSGNQLSEVLPGTYYLTVTDLNGCGVQDSITIDQCCQLEHLCIEESIEIDCIDDVPAIDQTLNNPFALQEDKLTILQGLDIDIATGFCGSLDISVSQTQNNPTTCKQDTLILRREFLVTDAHTTVSCVKNYFVSGFKGIEILTPAEDMNLLCDDVTDLDATFQDWLANNAGLDFLSCSDNATITTNPASPELIFTCGQNASATVEFIIEDACGNTNSTIADFILMDIAGPQITCPNNLTVDITGPDMIDMINNWRMSAIGDDNCSITQITDDFEIANLSTDCSSSPVVVNFVVSDECNNTDSCNSSIIIIQPDTPILTCGTDLIVDCQEDLSLLIDDWVATFQAVSTDGTSNDPDTDLVLTDALNLSCGDNLPVNFSFTDICNQEQICNVIIEVVDNDSPVLTCPDDITIDVNDQDVEVTVNDWLLVATTTDNCSQPSLDDDFTPEVLQRLCDLEFIVVAFTSEDICSNVSTCTSDITITKGSPSINCPNPLLLECGEFDMVDIDLWIESVTAVDNSTEPINNLDINLLSSGCDIPLVVEFSTSDNCNQFVNCESSIRITDTQAPNVTCPSNLEINITELNQQVIDDWIKEAIFDDCNNVILSHEIQGDLQSVTCTEDFPVAVIAQDECGNLNECNTLLSVFNELEPQISCPEPMDFRCSDGDLLGNINEYISTLDVESLVGYTTEVEFDMSILDTECEEKISTDMIFVVNDDCNNQLVCETEISLIPDPNIYIPNIFSPDGDGREDVFTVYGNESVDFVKTMIIYNRWGSKIFESNDFPINDESEGWGGTYRNQLENISVFSYHIVVMDIFGSEIPISGTIQILK